MNYTYTNGLPFSSGLDKCLDEQLIRIKHNFASMLIIDGMQGQGKTTLLVHMIDYINKKYGFKSCNLKLNSHPQIALGGKEFIKNFNICESLGYPVIGYDEAGDFSRRGSLTRFNQMLIRKFETFRSSRILVILCLPSFLALDNHLFYLGVPRGLIHLINREKTVSYGNYYAYSQYGMNWVRYWAGKLPKAIQSMAYTKTSFNFRGNFKNLPPKREAELARLSHYGKQEESLRAEIKAEGLIDFEQLTYKTNRSLIWVRTTISKLKIKPVRTVKKRKYFRGEVAERLLDYIDGLKK